jgi:hypothetical protein
MLLAGAFLIGLTVAVVIAYLVGKAAGGKAEREWIASFIEHTMVHEVHDKKAISMLAAAVRKRRN